MTDDRTELEDRLRLQRETLGRCDAMLEQERDKRAALEARIESIRSAYAALVRAEWGDEEPRDHEWRELAAAIGVALCESSST